ncbi:hypothetical protein IHE61_31040 [Streptomyces sp. GKU 257-1]|nr:hypothetical protein [Streptomyces sp. GKU 257-1]
MDTEQMRDDAETLRKNLPTLRRALQLAATDASERARDLGRMLDRPGAHIQDDTGLWTPDAIRGMRQDAEHQHAEYTRLLTALELRD